VTSRVATGMKVTRRLDTSMRHSKWPACTSSRRASEFSEPPPTLVRQPARHRCHRKRGTNETTMAFRHVERHRAHGLYGAPRRGADGPDRAGATRALCRQCAEGSYLAALVMYATLYSRTPVALPATLRLRDGSIFSVDGAVEATLQAAASEATAVSRVSAGCLTPADSRSPMRHAPVRRHRRQTAPS
jgi:hypothetical protein